MKLQINSEKEFKLTLGASMALAEALECKAISLELKAAKILVHSAAMAEEIAFQADQLLAVASKIREVL